MREAQAVFDSGAVWAMGAEGYDVWAAEIIGTDGIYDTPHGRLNSKIVWKKPGIPEDGIFRVQWNMHLTNL